MGQASVLRLTELTYSYAKQNLLAHNNSCHITISREKQSQSQSLLMASHELR